MMGFSTQLSIAALQACHNNVEVAIDFCLENQSSFVASPLSTPRGPQGSNAPPNSAPSAPSMSPSPSPLVQSAPGAIRSAGNNVTSNSAKAPTNASTKTSGAPMNSSSKESFSTAHSGNEDSDSDTDSVTMFMDDIDRQLHSVVSANAIRSLESDDLVTRIASQKLVAVREGSARVASQRTLNNDPTLQELQTTKPVSRPTSQRVRTSTAHASSADAGTEADGSSAEAIRQRNGMPVIITGLGSRDLDVGVVVSDSVDHADPTHITGRLQFSTDGNGTFFSSEESATDEWASERGESTDVGSTSGAPQRLSPVRLGLRSRESERWQSTDLDDEEEPAAKPPAIKPPPPPLAARTSITGATEPLHPTQPSVTQSAGPNYVTGQRSRDNSTERSSSADRANSIDRPSLLGLPPARMPDARLSQQGRPGVMPPPRGFARPVSSSIPMNPAATSGAATAATSSGASVATIPTVATTAFSGVTPTMAQSRSPPIPPRSSHQLPMTPLQIPADQVIVPSSVVSPFSSAATPSGPPSESSTGRNTFLGTFRRLMGDNTAESPTSRNRDFGQSNPDLSRFPQIPRRMLLPFEIFEVISEENPNRTEHRVFLTLKQPHKKNRSPQGSRTDRIYLGALSSSIRARRMGEAMAPPVWVSKEQHPNCVICDCSLTSGYIGQLGNHCRNCGYRVCSKCSTKWPSSMIPTTYHNNEKHVRVCDSCDILIERFAEALRTGKIEDAQAIFSTGNINAHCPLSIYDNLEYPIHAAVKSGNLSLVQWLLDDRAVPLVDAARKSFKTADGYTILGLAAKYGHTDIMKYLVTNHRCKVIEITNLLHMQRVLHVLFEVCSVVSIYIYIYLLLNTSQCFCVKLKFIYLL